MPLMSHGWTRLSILIYYPKQKPSPPIKTHFAGNKNNKKNQELFIKQIYIYRYIIVYYDVSFPNINFIIVIIM